MRTTARKTRWSDVIAVHAYEDCSLQQFEATKRLGKGPDPRLPAGYYDAWDETFARFIKVFTDWRPISGLSSWNYVRPVQKRRETKPADLGLAPSRFVERTILNFHPTKALAIAPYGADTDFWGPIRGPAVAALYRCRV